jgi:hypothetical protein
VRSGEPTDFPDGAPDAVPLPEERAAVDQQASPSYGSTAVQAGRDVTFIAEQHLHQTSAHERRPPARGRARALDDFTDLVDALLEVDSIRDDSARSTVLALLPVHIAGSVPHHPRARLHVIGLLRTCLDHEGGLLELVAVLRDLEGDSLPVRRLEARTRKWMNSS